MFWIAIGLLFILAVETYADFFLQSRKIATTKSTNPKALQEHVIIMIGAVSIPAMIVFSFMLGSPAGVIAGLTFSCMNGFVHGAIDWNIWKAYKLVVFRRLKGEKEAMDLFLVNKDYAEDSAFYNTIGVDRFLHVATIVILYFWFISGGHYVQAFTF